MISTVFLMGTYRLRPHLLKKLLLTQDFIKEEIMHRGKMVCLLGNLGISIFLFAGCGPAEFLNPLFEESERIQMPGLAGRWAKPDAENPQEEVLIFREKENRSYSFWVGEEDERYKGLAGQIGSDWYFEIHPEIDIRSGGRFKIPAGDSGNAAKVAPIPIADGLCLILGKNSSGLALKEDIEFEIRPTRMILKLHLEENLLDIWYLDEKPLKEDLEKGEIRLSHSLQPAFLVTAPTRELRCFLEEHGRETTPRLFTKLGSFRRI
jgi:hypothetical protein